MPAGKVTDLQRAVRVVLRQQKLSNKPLAIILAGHNGSGKSTMWHTHLADEFQVPLINADRMMLSILPETEQGHLRDWAITLRDSDTSWMRVAQKGVEAFVAQAMGNKVSFAMETVFSHWKKHPDGKIRSKIDLILTLQRQGYFVLLVFVGLSNAQLSVARVKTRVATGGHAVAEKKLRDRFPRTQKAIAAAARVADITVMADNSREARHAFSVCRIQSKSAGIFDVRAAGKKVPNEILAWLDVVSPWT